MQDCSDNSAGCTDACDLDCILHLEGLTRVLAQREADLMDFWKYARDIHCILTVEGRFKRVSSACGLQLGVTSEQMEGRLFRDFIHPDDVDQSDRMFRAIQLDATQGMELRVRSKHVNGQYVWIEWSASTPVNGLLYVTARVIEVVTQPTHPSVKKEDTRTGYAQPHHQRLRTPPPSFP